jgi:antitoxin (DNA-binding transcriptional repressor) of toxin-antitoxin stability system
MRSVGLKVLKNKLSEYVRLASGGETVLVTDRDRVVAELGPPRRGVDHPFVTSPFLADAVRKGEITLPRRRLDGPPPNLPVMTLEELLEEVERDRDDR